MPYLSKLEEGWSHNAWIIQIMRAKMNRIYDISSQSDNLIG